MEFYALKAFIAVSEDRSFSAAADRLHLTQPAVSKRIATLEQQLGARLFDRIGRTITLTQAGEALFPRAVHIMGELEESRRMITNLSGQISGRLSLGTSHHIGLHRLPPVLRGYTNRFAQVELDLHFMDSEAGCYAVEQGQLDLAVVTLPLKAPPKLLLTKVWDDPLDIVIALDHPLANHQSITLKELADHRAILPAINTYTRAILVRPFDERRLQLKVALETNYLETNKMMVAIGLGWSILPRTMLDQHLKSIPIEQLRLKRTLGIVQHRARSLSNAAKALVDMLLGKAP